VNPLARIVYNMVAEGAEAGAKASADDVMRAAGKIADEGVEAADDWGWKGGKPGELTGGEYHKRLDNLYSRYDHSDEIDRARWRTAEDKLRDKLDFEIENQIAQSGNARLKKEFYENSSGSNDDFATDMKELELAGIPREWTGKVWPVLRTQVQRRYDLIPPTLAEKVSDAMRSMTNAQREDFLALLPEWSESLDDLANAVRTL
jgi:hypothetical protein